ncbi:hypothetical protein OF83DRAFT_1263968 [Amylostereum chailletii]|nr:hypothetical protein OF83DRAFT_1263968 [Amylostereum chailletii]
MSSTGSGVFSVYASSVIDAPRDTVWKALLDFQSYGEWNPFVHAQVLVNDSNQPLPDQNPTEGQRLLQSVHIPPTLDGKAKPTRNLEILTHVDHRERCLAWRFASPAHCLLRAERWQTLHISASDGSTRYETWEVFGGLLAYLLRFFMRDKLEESFEAMTMALKARAEQTNEEGNPSV